MAVVTQHVYLLWYDTIYNSYMCVCLCIIYVVIRSNDI